MGLYDYGGSRMLKIYNGLLGMAGGVIVWYFAYVSAMAGAEFITAIPSAWLLGELLMPRKETQ